MTAIDALGWSLQNLSVGTMNTIVTNVPGPPFPLYLLGAELEQLMPFAPLLEDLGLSIGVPTYDGKLFSGLNADADRLPDLPDFRTAIERSFALADAAGVRLDQGSATRAEQRHDQRVAEAPDSDFVQPRTGTGHAMRGAGRHTSGRIATESAPDGAM